MAFVEKFTSYPPQDWTYVPVGHVAAQEVAAEHSVGAGKMPTSPPDEASENLSSLEISFPFPGNEAVILFAFPASVKTHTFAPSYEIATGFPPPEIDQVVIAPCNEICDRFPPALFATHIEVPSNAMESGALPTVYMFRTPPVDETTDTELLA